MRTIALLALAGAALAKKHIHHGESAHHAHHHHGEHHIAHHHGEHAHHGHHAHHHGEHSHHMVHHGEHAHHAHHHAHHNKPAGLAFFKKVATIGGEDSHSHKKFKNPLSKRSKRHMRKVHGGENGKPSRRVHNGEHKQRRRRNNKKVAKMNTKVVKVADEKKPATLALFKKVDGEDSHSHKKFKNPLSKKSKRHMRKVHGGENGKPTRRNRVHNGENKQRRRRNNKKVAKMNTKVTKVEDKKPAALGLYELSEALNLNQF